MGQKKYQQNNYSLYDLFTLGDRIAKDFRDESGRAFQRSGIIMAVDDIRIWDIRPSSRRNWHVPQEAPEIPAWAAKNWPLC